MNIFNSLGSNYSFSQVMRSLVSRGGVNAIQKLTEFLEAKYGGRAVLVYSGREAIRLALRSIDTKGSDVAVCGFTCFAVYEAMVGEGYGVEYIDIDKATLNFSAKALGRSLDKNSNIKVVMIQNTLGYPCEIEKIAEICRKKNLILIEDLAHSIGTVYKNKKEAGTFGDFVVLSFSQDKVIDSVSGGALINKNQESNLPAGKAVSKNRSIVDVPIRQKLKDRFYPLITFNIRKTYSMGVGKAIHAFSQKLNLLSKPMSYADYKNIHNLAPSNAREIYLQFSSLGKISEHRRKVAGVYKEHLNNKLLIDDLLDLTDSSSNLRFPIFVKNRESLIRYLAKNGVYISDIWYDAPISPMKYFNKTDYRKGICPNGEYISKKILNLPTHKNVSEKDAEKISRKINLWLKLQ